MDNLEDLPIDMQKFIKDFQFLVNSTSLPLKEVIRAIIGFFSAGDCHRMEKGEDKQYLPYITHIISEFEVAIYEEYEEKPQLGELH